MVASRYSELSWLVVAMLGQSVTASLYVDWMLHCKSVVVGRSISCVAGAVRNSKSLRGLHRRSIVVGSYGFVVRDSCAGVSFTVAMTLSC